MESQFGTKLAKEIIALGKWDYDVTLCYYYKNDKIRKKAGFDYENFKEIFKDTNIDGDLMYKMLWYSIDYYRRAAAAAVVGRTKAKDQFMPLKDHSKLTIDIYLEDGDYKKAEKEMNREVSALMNYLMFSKEVKL